MPKKNSNQRLELRTKECVLWVLIMLFKWDTCCLVSHRECTGANGRNPFQDTNYGSKTFQNPEYEVNRLKSDFALFAHK